MSERDWRGAHNGLLIDTGLLVLFTVGSVNPARIERFKRTSMYNREDHQLLTRIMSSASALFTVAHVMSEVSNLTDLKGEESAIAREVLAETIAILKEPHVSSAEASGRSMYGSLGLADSAISVVAREQSCDVLTDDLDLYLSLMSEELPAIKFSHLRELNWRR
jgi:hypothetical protein